MATVKKIAEILFILLALFIIVTVLMGYTSNLKENIMKLLGYKTESEKVHESNIISEKEFELLTEHIQACKESEKTDCGCTFNVNNFDESNMIVSKKASLELRDISNTKKSEAVKESDSGSLIKKSDIKDTNCFFDENKNKVDISIGRIFFDEKKLYLHRNLNPFNYLVRRSKIFLNEDYPLYINSMGDLCWLSDEVSSIIECK